MAPDVDPLPRPGSPPRGGRRAAARLGPVAVLAVVLAACAPTAPSPARGDVSPTPAVAASVTPGPGATPTAPPPAWVRAEVEQPTEIASGAASPPPFCSPCHPYSSTYLAAVAGTPGHLLAVGSLYPATAAAWSTSDGARWERLGGFPAADGSDAEAIATDGRRWIAGGGDRSGPFVALADDGVTWREVRLPSPAGGLVLAVLAAPTGYVAAGYVGPGAAQRPAAWWSLDGTAWTGPAILGPAGAVTGLAMGPSGTVAVGRDGSAETVGAAAWRSGDGRAWSAAPPDATLAAGPMAAVTAFGGGWVAVGRRRRDGAALTWTSADGLAWAAGPGGPALENYGQRIVMAGVATTGGRLVAVGWKSDAANGSAVVWRSDDGATWGRDDSPASFAGGGMAGIAVVGPIVAAVGTTGWPDSHVATAWLGAAP